MREKIANWLIRMASRIRGHVAHVDFDGGVDDVAISDVTLFRFERMGDRLYWMRLYMADGKDHVFWLDSLSPDHSIYVRHEEESAL